MVGQERRVKPSCRRDTAPGVRGSRGDADARREAIHIHELSASPRLRVNRLPGSRLTSITYIREHPQTFARIPGHSRMFPDILEDAWILANIRCILSNQFCILSKIVWTLGNVSGRLSNVENRLANRFCTLASRLVIRNWTLCTSARVPKRSSRMSTDIREDPRTFARMQRIFARIHGHGYSRGSTDHRGCSRISSIVAKLSSRGCKIDPGTSTTSSGGSKLDPRGCKLDSRGRKIDSRGCRDVRFDFRGARFPRVTVSSGMSPFGLGERYTY